MVNFCILLWVSDKYKQLWQFAGCTLPVFYQTGSMPYDTIHFGGVLCFMEIINFYVAAILLVQKYRFKQPVMFGKHTVIQIVRNTLLRLTGIKSEVV